MVDQRIKETNVQWWHSQEQINEGSWLCLGGFVIGKGCKEEEVREWLEL